MKNVNISTQSESVATFFVTFDGDLVDTKEECFGECAGSITMDSFFVGSLQDMRKYALEAYNA